MCKECIERGKTWEGSDPVCGFDVSGTFDPSNWNCATLNILRDYCYEKGYRQEGGYTHRDDSAAASIGVLHIPENDIVSGYLVMSWYKSRGRTGTANIICDDMIDQLSEDQAEAIIKVIKDRNK